MIAEGLTGTIELKPSAVVISRTAGKGFAQDVRSLKLTEITGVDFRSASFGNNGHIRIMHPSQDGSSLTKNFSNTNADAVVFTAEQQRDFVQIRNAILTIVTGEEHNDEIVPDTEMPGCVAAYLIVAGLVLSAIFYVMFFT
tara:strand:- start:1143 stop:1565 length:423 start_codon:yes stop_codon:yes gene_type:complete